MLLKLLLFWGDKFLSKFSMLFCWQCFIKGSLRCCPQWERSCMWEEKDRLRVKLLLYKWEAIFNISISPSLALLSLSLCIALTCWTDIRQRRDMRRYEKKQDTPLTRAYLAAQLRKTKRSSVTRPPRGMVLTMAVRVVPCAGLVFLLHQGHDNLRPPMISQSRLIKVQCWVNIVKNLHRSLKNYAQA